MRFPIRPTLYLAIITMYVLHNDLWLWDNGRIVFGLPVGLTYHVGFALTAAVLMFLLTHLAWPKHLEITPTHEAETNSSSPEQALSTDDGRAAGNNV